MKTEYEVNKEVDDYAGEVSFRVNEFVDGNFFGVIGFAESELDAHFMGKYFNPRADDARILKAG